VFLHGELEPRRQSESEFGGSLQSAIISRPSKQKGKETTSRNVVLMDRKFSNIKLQRPVALCRSDFAFRFLAVYVQRRLLFIVYHYMFRPNRPSSGVRVFVMKDSAAHCNAVLLIKAVVTITRRRENIDRRCT
jgi:hypothetical protein